jgi:hypothetical protein
MKKFYYILFLLISHNIFSQTINVIDELSRLPIPYTSIYLIDNNKIIGGLSCDENGKAELPATNYEFIKISSIGYEDLTIDHKDVKSFTFVLKPKATELNEVIISNKTVETIAYKGKKGRYLGMLKDVEIILYFKNPFKKPVTLKSFSFATKKTIVENKIRIVMYSVKDSTKHSQPGEMLLNQDIIFTLKPAHEGEVKVDLTQYGIVLPPDGAYIGIDIIDVYDALGKYSFDKQHMNEFETINSKEKIFLSNHKYTNKGWENINDIWEKTLKTTHGMWGKKKYFVIPSFSIEVFTD